VSATVHCNGCGFNVERGSAIFPITNRQLDERECDICKTCEAAPDLREAYRRGFNDGLNAFARTAAEIKDDLWKGDR
jgi:hypothetical protein